MLPGTRVIAPVRELGLELAGRLRLLRAQVAPVPSLGRSPSVGSSPVGPEGLSPGAWMGTEAPGAAFDRPSRKMDGAGCRSSGESRRSVGWLTVGATASLAPDATVGVGSCGAGDVAPGAARH